MPMMSPSSAQVVKKSLYYSTSPCSARRDPNIECSSNALVVPQVVPKISPSSTQREHKECSKSISVPSEPLFFCLYCLTCFLCYSICDWFCLHWNFYQLQGLEGGQIVQPFALNWSDCEERKKGIQEGEICLQSFRNNPLCSIPDAAAPSNKYLRLKKKIQSGANIILKWNTYKKTKLAV